MALGIAFGLGLGTIAGLSVGPQLFPRLLKPKDLSCLDESADYNEEVEAPEPGSKIGADMRRLLNYTEPWTTNPDYQRVSMINRMIKIMWPTLTKAILDTVLVQVKKQLEAKVFKNKKLGFIEDIVFGTDAMHPDGVKDFSAWVKDKHFNVGSIPPRVGGLKLYDTSEDEVILEVPMLFGSDMKMDVGVFLRFGPFRLYVPVEISNLQLKSEVRLTLKPLVDTIPCIGGATISLLQVPHVDFSLKVVGGVDLMALPIVKDMIKLGMKYVLEGLLIMPNSMSFPIMPNFGLMPPPKGAINIKLLRVENVKGSVVYAVLEIRAGRTQTSRSVRLENGNGEYGEEFNLIVDDFELQTLKIHLFTDDSGWNDTKIAHGQLRFGEYEEVDETAVAEGEQPPERDFKLKEFIKVPMHEVLVEVQMRKSKKAKNVAMSAVGGVATGASAVSSAGISGAKSFGASLKRIMSRRGGPPPGAESVLPTAQLETPKSKIETLETLPSETVKDKDDGGRVYLKVMFMPFFQPTYDDEDDEPPVAADAAMSSTVPAGAATSVAKAPEAKKKEAAKKAAVSLPSVRQVTTKVPDKLKGVLTVTLIRCINLMGDDVNSYVRFLVSDDDQDQVQKSAIVFSQNSPRWGQKFDFVMVTAGSSLFMTVYKKRGVTSNVLKTVNIFAKKKEEEETDKVLGKLEIRVRDVVRNGTLKDIWTLQDAEKGQIELVLAWQTCYISDE